MNTLTHGSLFSGIGGFELGAKLENINTLWNCEIKPFNRKILNQHFKETYQYEDIRTMYNPQYVDIISGGFPCQDISINGRGNGINGERSGLWKQMFRICSEVRPKYIIIENSPALAIRGIEQVLSNLAQIGYDAEWSCIPNCAFSYPHRRERLFIIAYPNGIRPQSLVQDGRSYDSIFQAINKTGQIYALSLSEWFRQQRTDSGIGSNIRIPNYVDRIEGVGNAVNPIIAKYLFNCIKKHYETTR